MTYPLTINKTGNGQVSCGDGVCAATYTAGAQVTLTATPDTGWQFNSWTGCAAAAATPTTCTVSMSQARTVTARFTQLVTYALTISKTGNGQVSCDDGVCAPTYRANAGDADGHPRHRLAVRRLDWLPGLRHHAQPMHRQHVAGPHRHRPLHPCCPCSMRSPSTRPATAR